MNIPFLYVLSDIAASYRARKAGLEPDLRRWEFFVQMLCSAYLSWRWLGKNAKFQPWRPAYWLFLAHYSSLSELGTRAGQAANRYREQQAPANSIKVYYGSGQLLGTTMQEVSYVYLPFQIAQGEVLAVDRDSIRINGAPVEWPEELPEQPALPRTTRPNPSTNARF